MVSQVVSTSDKMLHPLTDEAVGHRHSYTEVELGVART